MIPTGAARWLTWAAAISLPVFACAEVPADAPGLMRDVVFTEYSDRSRNAELVQRLLTPLVGAAATRRAATLHRVVRQQPIDLAREKFVLYVPPRAPPQGYSLLVFVPPWSNAALPPAWAAVLDRHGMIFVGAANSGNDANVLDRRIPLALLAAQNVRGRFPIDPSQVYIGGFSGGSRVALRAALAYPDVFHGVLLNAGSDPIGDDQAALPTLELFQQFQDSTRIVYLTGKDDRSNIERDEDSRHSLRGWCVFGLSVETMPWAGHQAAAPPELDRALNDLAEPVRADPSKLADCREGVARQMHAQLERARDLIRRGQSADARALLKKIDAHYGGLAAPQSVELDARADLTP